jgi:hypothetical protein
LPCTWRRRRHPAAAGAAPEIPTCPWCALGPTPGAPVTAIAAPPLYALTPSRKLDAALAGAPQHRRSQASSLDAQHKGRRGLEKIVPRASSPWHRLCGCWALPTCSRVCGPQQSQRQTMRASLTKSAARTRGECSRGRSALATDTGEPSPRGRRHRPWRQDLLLRLACPAKPRRRYRRRSAHFRPWAKGHPVRP